MQINRVKYKEIEQIPRLKINKHFKQSFQGSIASPFVGRVGYPSVNVGLLSPQFSGEMDKYDSPLFWSNNNSRVGEIATNRYSLVNSRKKEKVKSDSSYLSLVKEAAMAKAVDMEISLTKLPKLNLNEDSVLKPFGPGSTIQKARITTNPKINTNVEKVVYDTDLKSTPGILKLYQKGFEENSLHKLLSVGNLGLKKNRKLVPTRWSITATDDTIGKELITQVKKFPVGEYQAYFGGEWGNYYLLLFLPDVWSYELFETYLSLKINPWSKHQLAYSTDYESYSGRKNYAEETAGGYYAARLPILELMRRNKRQNTCLALRFITNEYTLPLGVWVCREAARKAATSKQISFSTETELLNYATTLIKEKFNFDLSHLLNKSKILAAKVQTKLGSFI